MKTSRAHLAIFGAVTLFGLTLALALPVRAQSTDVAATPPPEKTATPAAEPAVSPATVEAPTTVAAPEPAPEPAMRRLDEPAPETTTSAAPTGDTEMSADADESDKEMAADDIEVKVTRHRRHGSSAEMPFGDHTVPVGRTVRELVSLLGSSVLNGESEGAVVSILGNTTVNGKAGAEAVAVLGSNTINGEVAGEVVAVLGDVTLGERAVVRGDVIAVGGQLYRADGAVVQGNIQEINVFGHHDMSWLKAWIHQCLLWGRPLAFGDHLGWAWTIAISVFVAYVLLALLFPKAVEKCAETLEQRPGYSLLAVLLSVLIAPVLIIVLIATGVGILLLPFVAAGLFFGSIFGKVVMHAWLGRRITRYFGPGPMKHVATATLIGGILVLLLYTVPFLGFFLWKVLGMLGLGVVIYTLVLTMKSEKAEAQRLATAAAAVAAGTSAGVVAAPENPDAAATAATLAPSNLPLTAMPRAGFWLRLAASLLDAILVGVVAGITHTGEIFLLLYAVYCVVLWALKGSTIGGIVCGLKVVRLDDRKVDWTVAIVRGLGGFLSLAVAGLGFVWVAFDKERQSWHDKIAGTIVVQVPKGVSLV